MTAPLSAFAAWYLSSCECGPPSALYASSFMKVVGAVACDQRVVQLTRSGLEAHEDETFWQPFNGAVEESSSWRTVFEMEDTWWVVLACLGALNLLDLDTDNLQIGQIRACDVENSSFNAQYVHSFHLVWIRWGVSHIRFVGLYIILLLEIYLVQGVRGMYDAYSLWTRLDGKVFADTLTSELGAMAEAATWSSMLYTSSVIKRSLKRRIEMEKQQVEQVSEESDAARRVSENAQTVAKQAAVALSDISKAGAEAIQRCKEVCEGQAPLEPAERDLMEKLIIASEEAKKADDDAVLKQDAAKKALDRAQHAKDRVDEQLLQTRDVERAIAFNDVLVVVAGENAPSLYLVSGFFALRHGEGALTNAAIVKIIASILMSSYTALRKAAQVSKFGHKGALLCVAIFTMVAYALVKTFLALKCTTGFFSFQTMACDQAVS